MTVDWRMLYVDPLFNGRNGIIEWRLYRAIMTVCYLEWVSRCW
jgi:hypothetical protein